MDSFRLQQTSQQQYLKPKRDSSSFGRLWSTNDSQLDKIDAIPNRPNATNPRDNALIDGLCLEDQIYLQSLVEVTDSSEGEDGDDESNQLRDNTWKGPMIQKPVVVNKRLKLRKAHYAVTLSLEDISYIRPSWGLSRGMRGIQVDKKHKKRRRNSVTASIQDGELSGIESGSQVRKITEGQLLGFYLIMLTIVVIVLMSPSVFIERQRKLAKLQANKIKLSEEERLIEIYRPSNKYTPGQQPIFKLKFGQNIPLDLRAESCDCKLFKKEKEVIEKHWECIACLDWAYRSNLRIFIERLPATTSDSRAAQHILPELEEHERDFCYHIKWQNYNTLMAPLVDCFTLEDEHWFGFGDVLENSWPITRLDFDWLPLKSNLTSDLLLTIDDNFEKEDRIDFGSFVNLTLLSSTRIFLGNLRSDFEILTKLSRDASKGKKLMCLSATCTDRCTETWQRDDHIDDWKLENNIFEYSICSMSSFKKLMMRQVSQKSRDLRREPIDWLTKRTRSKPDANRYQINTNQTTNNKLNTQSPVTSKPTAQPTPIASPFVASNISQQQQQQQQPQQTLVKTDNTTGSTTKVLNLPDGIGLIDRIVFATSMEYLPVLDGSTIREYVDSIVNLDLKSSIILSIDTRWQTYEGSFKLNSALFPKAKLLLEILHNKGFKIIFSIKPYIDGMIGLRAINELFAADRLYPTNFVDHKLLRKSDPRRSEELSHGWSGREFIIRRDSFFKFRNQSVRIRSKQSEKFPHLFNCKESLINSCALFDLTKPYNREAIITSIKKTDLLAYGADGIRIGGVHSNFFAWQGHYRESLSELVKDLFYREKLFTLSRYSGDFGYIELAPRAFTWSALRSSFNSVLNLGMMGFSIVHPGSVWGDLKTKQQLVGGNNPTVDIDSKLKPNNPSLIRFNQRATISTDPSSLDPDLDQASDKSDEELAIRWLQLYSFMPVLQFNNLEPIERFQLHNQMRTLIRMRKTYLVGEIKRNLPYTPLVTSSKQLSPTTIADATTNKIDDSQMPLIRPIWISNSATNDIGKDTIIAEQFSIGSEIIVAPILNEGQRQRDIYLPSGLWRDELRHVSIRGGKWLRNYPVELNEIAWFSLDKR